MFENLIGHTVLKETIKSDIENSKIPPSILFSGEKNGGKLTAALELARVMSCTKDARWQCDCLSCKQHRELNNSDLLILGSRDCSLEINAAANTVLQNPSIATGFLFLRAVKKLTNRFDSRIWDTDESKFLKAAPLLADTDALLTDFFHQVSGNNLEIEALKKQIEKILKATQKIQDECMYDSIPVNHVRKASSWVRLMPTGKKKFLIIENADKMQESARNAFLKILEEPPEYAHFILTTSNRGAIMQTILSRVRPYTFTQRTVEEEKNIIARVFRDSKSSKENSLTSYLYKFLPVDLSLINNAAVSFWNILIKDYASKKEQNSGLISAIQKAVNNLGNATAKNTIAEIITSVNNCKPETVFILLLEHIFGIINSVLHTEDNTALRLETYAKISQYITEAKNAHSIYNISVKAVLENLIVKIGTVL